MRRSNPGNQSPDSHFPRKVTKVADCQDEALLTMLQWLAPAACDVSALDDDAMQVLIAGMDKEQRIELVLQAIAASRRDILLRLISPVQVGGFGWPLDVQALDGRTPVNVAVEKDRQLALSLLVPVANQGGGLLMDKRAVKGLMRQSIFKLEKPSHYHYRKKKLTRQHSFVEHTDAVTGEKEQYFFEKAVGAGTYSFVRLFQSANDHDKKLILKQLLADDAGCGLSSYVRVRECDRELYYMHKAYPDLAPYVVQHRIERKNKKHHAMFIMPYMQGLHGDQLLASLNDVTDVPLLFVEIAKELRRLHTLGIVHGDVKITNIIIHHSPDHDNSRFTVRFVDFGFSQQCGEQALAFTTHVDYLAPELYVDADNQIAADKTQDIYSFGFMLKQSLVYLEEYLPGETAESGKVFLQMREYANRCMNHTAALRPDLSGFIDNMSKLMVSSSLPRFC